MGVAADANAVGSQINSLRNSGLQFKQFSMSGNDASFYISAKDDTTSQYYRRYFIIVGIGQGAELFIAGLTWRGYSGNISVNIIHGTGSITHSNGTISMKMTNGSWGTFWVLHEYSSATLTI